MRGRMCMLGNKFSRGKANLGWGARRWTSMGGFSVVEVIVSLGITLLVLGITFQITRLLRMGFTRQTELARVSDAVERAFDDLCWEIARAGYGLEKGVPSIVPAAGADSTSAIVVRSSSPAASADAVSSTDGPSAPQIEEVRFYLRPAADGGGNWLMKSRSAGPDRVLAGGVEEMRFEYFDEDGREIPPETLARRDVLKTVKITLRFVATDRLERQTLTTAVTVDQHRAVFNFAEPGYGLRMSRIFYPIFGPTAVMSETRDGVTAILSAGFIAGRDPSYVLTFAAAKGFVDARVEQLIPLDEVRGPAGACFGAGGTAVAGELFLVSPELNAGELHRVRLGDGAIVPTQIQSSESTEALAQAIGIACGPDGSIYAASGLHHTLYRFGIDPKGSLSPRAEIVARLPGRPLSMAIGLDGSIYVAVEMGLGSDLWRVPFEGSEPARAPHKAASFAARLRSMTVDSLSGYLYVLAESPFDTTIVQLDSGWLDSPREIPSPLFSLEQFRRETNGQPAPKPVDYGAVSSFVLSPRLPPSLVPDEIDFIAFDASGFLYLGASERSLVLQFDLDRDHDPAYSVTLGATVEPARAGVLGPPAVQLRAWTN